MDKIYEELDVHAGATIEQCVKMLLEYKKQNKLASVDFNGNVLYSDTVTLDNAYITITGKSHAEYTSYLKKEFEEIERARQEHLASIPEKTLYWIEEGKKVLEEDKLEYWNKIVPIRLKDLYEGFELKACLDIIKLLKENKFKEAKDLFHEQGHSGMSGSLLLGMIKEFALNGQEFLVYMSFVK